MKSCHRFLKLILSVSMTMALFVSAHAQDAETSRVLTADQFKQQKVSGQDLKTRRAALQRVRKKPGRVIPPDREMIGETEKNVPGDHFDRQKSEDSDPEGSR